MSDPVKPDGPTTAVEWAHSPAPDQPKPIVARRPSVELKLEHPDLDPSGYGDSFFPDAVPYEIDGTHRVFYWRPTLSTATADPDDWDGVCATTHGLSVVTPTEKRPPDLVSRRTETTELVVNGTIAGDSTTAVVDSYRTPDVRIDTLSESRVELIVDETHFEVPAGTRRRISLPEQSVERADEPGGEEVVSPELVVRFPGNRELHHPALDGVYRLFPSFGMDLSTVPNPVPVPTANGELDYLALATALGVDLAARPYPERVLWQAFAYEAFDPHASGTPELTQFDTGHLALLNDPADA